MSREFTHTDERALPVWLGEKERINEPLFCEELLKDKQLRYINGSFFSTMGAVDENELSAQIYKTISPYVTRNVGRHTENIMKALKLRCFGTDIIALPDEINVLNGILKNPLCCAAGWIFKKFKIFFYFPELDKGHFNSFLDIALKNLQFMFI